MGDKPKKKSGSRWNTDKTNWREVIKEVQEKLLLSQNELAEESGIAQQTISGWINYSRIPGAHSRRKLIEYLIKNGIEIEAFQLTDRNKVQISEKTAFHSSDLTEQRLLFLFRTLNEKDRQDIVDYTSFKANKAKFAKMRKQGSGVIPGKMLSKNPRP